MGDSEVWTIHVEACQKKQSSLISSEIEAALETYINQQEELVLNKVICDAVLPDHLKYVRFCSDRRKNALALPVNKVKKIYHVYQVWEDGPQVDSVLGDDDLPGSLVWCLPNVAFEGFWENVIIDDYKKEQLMSYVQTASLYAAKQVNHQLVLWNGILLLYGPPGTGKTTLCKALAQKLSIRLGSKYNCIKLIEINSHSLFSKWFSESAKLVLQMFTMIKQWLSWNNHFVCILIDEVESLTQVRVAKECEPSDAVRVVNAVLTQIDQLQRYPNFLILSTSNLTSSIDFAFADRADLKLYIGYPSPFAVYEIYTGCIEELINRELVRGSVNDFFEVSTFSRMNLTTVNDNNEVVTEIVKNSLQLWEAAKASEKLSGRSVRKIPFLTSAKFVGEEVPTVGEFLKAMKSVIGSQTADNLMYMQNGRLFY